MAARSKVMNKAAAAVQVTAEQLMREAWERQDEEAPRPPSLKIVDAEELADYQLRKRTEFENALRLKGHSAGIWVRYARWEESQNEIERARSIFERCIEMDYRNSSVWMKYVDMEIRQKNVNHARNIFDRAVQLLPRVHQFWYKYILMEYRLANYVAVRRLYERWMEWEPDRNAYNAYIKFELQAGELDRVRQIFSLYVKAHSHVDVYLKWAKFEETQGDIARARAVFEEALEVLADEKEQHAKLYLSFARFEERAKEYDRARAIYRFALDRIPKAQARAVFDQFISFEKQHGDKEAIEHIIIAKRRFQYEELLAQDHRNYDVWFDYLRLEESNGEIDRIRELYERAIASSNLPLVAEKIYWKRYIYIWLSYALFEELDAQDPERTRAVYSTLIKVIPHSKFTFAKVWIAFANFEIRQHRLDAARKVYGHAIGMAPSDKLYESYIELEMQLGNIDRVRVLFEKWLTWRPDNAKAWNKLAELEAQLGEEERSRGIYELAIGQPALDMPELVWKAYIDYETQLEAYDRARTLYRRLLERTQHVKVWMSFAKFEAQIGKIRNARAIYEEAFEILKPLERTEDRVLLIEAWRNFEEEHGDAESQDKVRRNMPTRVKKRRKLLGPNGEDAGYEEFYDYIFPDMKQLKAGIKLMEAAKKWKMQQAQQASS